MTPLKRNLTLGIVLAGVLGAIFILEPEKLLRPGSASIAASTETPAEKAGKYPRAQELVNPSGFINTDPFTIAEHIGKKVILVDFWTYSCINCQRTQPYLNAWQEKYGDQGLLIVGVHTPEFDFEKVQENVAQATRDSGIQYPVVMDNDYGTWSAYGNRYWPRKYLIDIDGYVVYDHIGEGGYAETEQEIQKLLAERAERLGLAAFEMGSTVRPQDAEEVLPGVPYTPEIYFGALRNASYLSNGTVGQTGPQYFVAPEAPRADRLYLGGNWTIEREYAEADESGSKIVLKFRAKKVFMVASAPQGSTVRVLLDGEPVGVEEGGDDVQQGLLQVKKNRLYRIIELPEYGEHTLELISDDDGLQVFTFTFG